MYTEFFKELDFDLYTSRYVNEVGLDFMFILTDTITLNIVDFTILFCI